MFEKKNWVKWAQTFSYVGSSAIFFNMNRQIFTILHIMIYRHDIEQLLVVLSSEYFD